VRQPATTSKRRTLFTEDYVRTRTTFCSAHSTVTLLWLTMRQPNSIQTNGCADRPAVSCRSICSEYTDSIAVDWYHRNLLQIIASINDFFLLFTALHVMQTRYSEENSVCPSVCPSVRLSVTRVDCDRTVERSVQIYIPYERTFILVF